MNFFNIGPVELILILVVALIVFGPGRLPELGAGLGKAIREFQLMSQGLTEEFNRELRTAQEAARVDAAAEPRKTEPEPPPPAQQTVQAVPEALTENRVEMAPVTPVEDGIGVAPVTPAENGAEMAPATGVEESDDDHHAA